MTGNTLHRLRSAVLILAIVALPAFAHNPGLSTITIAAGNDTITITEVFAPRDLAVLLNVQDSEALRGPDALTPYQTKLKAIMARAIRLDLNDKRTELTQVRFSLDNKDNCECIFEVPRQGASRLKLESLLFDELPLGHRQFLSIRDAHGTAIVERVLSATASSYAGGLPALSTLNTEAKSEVQGGAFTAFLELGIKHILTGYDHILFLIALLIVSQSLTETIKVISYFTVAHSITLGLATLGSVNLSPSLVEPLIACSIVYVGIENLIFKGSTQWRWVLVFLFGLVHGLGFASGLRELGIGSNEQGIAIPLLSFNLGVEVGQLLIALAVLPLIARLRSRPIFVRRVAPACSILISMAGTYWFIERCLTA